MMFQTNTETCLVSALKKCKQSSKEAVENLGDFSSFKQYMHESRPVEEELEQLISKAHASSGPQLILVCGGVGDGKSHLISYFKKQFPYLEQDFYLHNDATESFEPQKTSIETLAEVFKSFSDEGLADGSRKKAILAINLGALNNFIDSEYGDKYSKLRQFVQDKKILESAITENPFDPQSPFQFINFSDYHMFQITEKGPQSPFVEKLIKKITAPVEANPFYMVYQNECLSSCPVAAKCPVKHNYELLSDDVIQKKVIDLLIQAIIKEKVIVSTRALLNLMHDLIVAPRLESLTDQQVKKYIENSSFDEYIDEILPVLMFMKSDGTPIHQALQKLSPSQIRSELLDQKYIEFRSREDATKVFEENVELQHFAYFASQLRENAPWLQQTMDAKASNLKQKLLRLFVYLFFFAPKDDQDWALDKDYAQFMKYLYFWNRGEAKELSELYRTQVYDAVYKWNGEGNGNSIYVKIGQVQTQFKTLQSLDIEPYVSNLTKRSESTLSKFLTSMKLTYRPKGINIFIDIVLDFSLYQLLCNIRNGYRPNKKDKMHFIKFEEFVDRLSSYGRRQEEITVEEREGSRTRRFTLKYDSVFEKYSFVEM